MTEATGRFSVVRLPRHWYVACLSRELKRRPIARTVLDVPLALFRDKAGSPAAVLDRCPHRNMPLSLGRCRDGLLECRYHGWRFDGDGACRLVPGLADAEMDTSARRAETFRVAEQDGFVWVVPGHGTPTAEAPPAMPHVAETGYATVRRRAVMPAGLYATLENILDVPHTAFLHRGLFRGGRRPVPVQVTVRHGDGRVEAVFEGEPRPSGLAARVLAAGDGAVEHVDRFMLPSLAQVEYRLGGHHVVITSACTPVSDFETRLHAAVTFRLPVPPALARVVVTPVAEGILRQDRWALRHQTANVRRFGGERYASTPIDVLGPHILRLLRRAERGESGPDSGVSGREERLTLYA